MPSGVARNGGGAYLQPSQQGSAAAYMLYSYHGADAKVDIGRLYACKHDVHLSSKETQFVCSYLKSSTVLSKPMPRLNCQQHVCAYMKGMLLLAGLPGTMT